MAATPPSSEVPVPPVSSVTPPPQPSSPPTPLQPQPSTPPPQSQPSTPPPQSQPSTPPPQPQPQPSTPPPVSSSPPPVENQVPQPNADPPEPATPPPPSSPPPNSAPPPSNAGNPPPATPPPVDSSPPPAQNAPPPTPAASPPPTPVQPPPSSNSPPPQPGVSPPPPDPPVSSPPPAQPAPPPQSPPSPPTSAPPPPPTTSPSPPSSSSPPPTSSPSPPAPSSEPPAGNPPPSSTKPPESSPSPPTSTPPKSSPSPPATEPPRSSPSPPAGEPPSDSPPTTSTPPPSDSQPASPPPSTPGTPNPVPGTPQSPGAPSLEGRNSSLGPPQNGQEGGNGGNSHTGAIAIGIVVGVLMLGLIGLVAFWVVKRKKRASGANGGGGYSGGYVIPASLGSSPRSDGKLLVKTGHPPFGGGSGTDTPIDHGGYGHSRAWFTYQELVEATGGFSDENLLGEGGFGYVYKGILTDGRVVAVKQLKVGGGQGEREFKAEVEIISRIHHRHLVSLVGYCIWESRRLLVYDYVPNNTLHFHLYGGGPFMDWATRVKIAAGAARGIAYLHEDCHPRIIHRDIKSSNILLDNNFEARVSDFGLAKLALDADTHVSTRVMGTFGYLAPEYATSGKLTEKSDLYSFGVVLLELVTGRKPVDETQPLGDESLVEWARPLLTHAIDTGDFGALVDPRLENNYIESEMYRMIEAAGACVRHSAAKRPRMGQVVRAIDGISDSGDLSNGLRVGESQLYDSAQQSAEIRWFRRMAFGSQDISTDFYGPAIQNLAYSSQSDSSRQHNQSSQVLGLARTSAQNIHFPVQQGKGGDISRQHSQSAQTLAVLGQNVNLPGHHEHNETSQNLGFSRQSGQNVNFPPQQGQGGNIARQHSNSTYYHSTQHSLNQGSRNLNFSREDSLNR